jgi:hypothetical protein
MVIVPCEGQPQTRQAQKGGGGGVAPTHSHVGARRLVVNTTFRLLYLTGRIWYPLYRMLCEPSSRSGWKGKYRPHRDTIPVATRYTDKANSAAGIIRLYKISTISFTSSNWRHAMNLTAILQSHTYGHDTIQDYLSHNTKKT